MTGTNIFHLAEPLAEIAADSTPSREHFFTMHETLRTRLFNRREKRIRPHKDDKILTDWNGLMMAALAQAAQGARILADDTYLRAAEKGARFILSRLQQNDLLLHRYRDGESGVEGMLCDYAYLVWGLLELYGADNDPGILGQAIRLNQNMLDLFIDLARFIRFSSLCTDLQMVITR